MTSPQQLDLGLLHHREGRLREAEQIYRQILTSHPDHPDALHLLGVVMGQSARPDLAIQYITRAIQLRPDVPDYHANLGEYLRHAANLESSASSFRHAIRLKANDPIYHNGLGVTLAQSRQFEPAIEEFRAAIRLKPDYSDAHGNLAGAHFESGQFEEAIIAYKQAITLLPNIASSYNSLGIAFQKLGRLDEAVSAFHQATALSPTGAEYFKNLGMILSDIGKPHEALAAYRKAISLQPDNPEYLYKLGIALEDFARPADALAAYRHALALKPDYPEAHMSSGMIHLLLGDWKTGWQEYEWRTQCSHTNIRRDITQPQWKGEPLDEKTILLHAEQGLGDTIQFIRFAPLIAQRGGRVIVETWPELTGILQSVGGINQLIPRGQPLPAFDFHSPLLSLPLAFATTPQNVPSQPYISAPADRISAWRDRLGNPDGRARIGLVWAGRPEQRDDRRRSMRFDHFAPLAEIKSARFYSLQKGPAASQALSRASGMDLVNFSHELGDFVETAALIAHLDLVICVCTAVAHLAGAMGKPVWILLSHQSDWRWMLNRIDTPWYPSARLFRQKSIGDWPGVVADVKRALADIENPNK